MDEVGVTCHVALQLVPAYFTLDLAAELPKHRTDIPNTQMPCKIAEDDEIVDSGVTIGMVVGKELLLHLATQLQQQKIL